MWHVDRVLYRLASLLPPPWDSTDIGAVGTTGFAGYVDGAFYVGGDGADIWGTADAFRFVYQPVAGDADIVARVIDEVAAHPFAKAAVMFRQSLDPSSLQVILDRKPDLVLVYGDVNSTVAAALVCAKLRVRVGHVEAGLRSFDRTMPEEVNRVLTDQVADLLFTPSVDGNTNLAREGIAAKKVFLVGNVMIDTLVRMLPKTRGHVPMQLPQRYALVTLHRPSNIDDLDWLRDMLEMLSGARADLGVVFPVHPRTRQRMSQIKSSFNGNVRLLEPLPYLQFLELEQGASLVITDSGGIQEETTFLGIPCLTVRDNTERPITVELGTNELVGLDLKHIAGAIERVLDGSTKTV